MRTHGSRQNLDDRARSARAKAGAAASTPATTSAGASEATLILTPMMPPTMSEHRQWTIRVSPRRSGIDRKWRALVEIWRPDREPNTHNATVVPFARTAADQGAVIAVARMAARAYIDASA